MNIKTGIGVTTLCAMLVAVPVFGHVNAEDLNLSGSDAAVEAVQTTETVDLSQLSEEEVTTVLEGVQPEEETSESAGVLPGEDKDGAEVQAPEEAELYDETGVVSVTGQKMIPKDGVNGSFTGTFETEIPAEGFDSDTLEQLYDTDPEYYEDENLRKLAQEYLDKGYYISDILREAELLGAGIGYGEVFFTSGFCAVDDKSGNNSFITYVAKATAEEFERFAADWAGNRSEEAGVISYVQNDGVNDITIRYDTATQIFVYTNVFAGGGLG